MEHDAIATNQQEQNACKNATLLIISYKSMTYGVTQMQHKVAYSTQS